MIGRCVGVLIITVCCSSIRVIGGSSAAIINIWITIRQEDNICWIMFFCRFPCWIVVKHSIESASHSSLPVCAASRHHIDACASCFECSIVFCPILHNSCRTSKRNKCIVNFPSIRCVITFAECFYQRIHCSFRIRPLSSVHASCSIKND